MNRQITIAAEDDYPKIKRFAEKVGVDCPDADGIHFFMLEKSELAASAGVKIVESHAILRALIIDREQCGLGEAFFLLSYVCKEAKKMGAEVAYLMTTVPSYIFQLSGFTQVEQSDLPDVLFNYPPFSDFKDVTRSTIMMRFLYEL